MTPEQTPTTDSPMIVDESTAQYHCTIEDCSLASVATPLRGVLDPDSHFRQPQITPSDVAARISAYIRDADDQYGPGSTPDFLHVGWTEHNRRAFETLVSEGMTGLFRLVTYCFLEQQIREEEDDLSQFQNDPQQKAFWIMRRNLCINMFDEYTPLGIDQLYVVRFAGTTDGSSHIHHIQADDDATEFPVDTMTTHGRDVTVTVIELTEQDDSDLIDFDAVPGVGTTQLDTPPETGVSPEEFISQSASPADSDSSPHSNSQNASSTSVSATGPTDEDTEDELTEFFRQQQTTSTSDSKHSS